MATVCFLSDSHGNLSSCRAALAEIQALHPTRIFHCGDIDTPEVIRLCCGLPIQFVFGNCDIDRMLLNQTAQECGFQPIEEIHQERIAHKSFFVYHGTNPNTLERAIGAQAFDYVLHGHTHLRRDERIGKTRVINPGALYRAAEYSFASLDIETDMLCYHVVPK